jgi:signal transduction histidine kinase
LTDKLQTWLLKNQAVVREATLYRAVNMLPDEEDVTVLLALLVKALDEGTGGRLRLVQDWANHHVGQDTALAEDWLAVLRVIKDVVGEQLAAAFPAAVALEHYRELDRIIMYAVVELARLTSATDHNQLLDHMVDLRKRMARLDQNKASFIKVAAHELRTPLTLLEGYASMLRAMSGTDPTQLKMLLDGFDTGIARLRNIIADMIDVTMIDADAIDLHFQPVFPEKIVRVVAENLRDSFTDRQVTLNIDPFPLWEAIFGDPERLYQAFEKLVTNSLKYTPDGGRVSISSRLVPSSGQMPGVAGYMVVEISDNGIGIDPENLERIFEVFSGIQGFNLHSSGKTKFKGGGAGLGLPIVRGIVEAHGGRVWADSPGFDELTCPGSTFFVELPVRIEPPGSSLIVD